MRPYLLSLRQRTLPIREGAQPILQLYRLHGLTSPRDSLLFLQSCLCQYVKDLMRNKAQSGEYRGRTDDLLHAMQAL